MSKIAMSIQEDPERKAWAYSVEILGGFHKIGYGHDFESALRLAASGARSANKYLKSVAESKEKE